MQEDKLRACTVAITAAYVRGNTIHPAELPILLTTVFVALRDLCVKKIDRKPATPIRHSVRPNSIVCLECGFWAKIIRRHLHSAHGLTAEAYRERWSLPLDYPLTAPLYSQERSRMAKANGLGKRLVK